MNVVDAEVRAVETRHIHELVDDGESLQKDILKPLVRDILFRLMKLTSNLTLLERLVVRVLAFLHPNIQ